jgi:hypothetical protein
MSLMMMTNPITPPPELVHQMTDHFVDTNKMVSLNPLPELVYRLRDEAPYGNLDGGTKRELHLIDAAYRAGADAELEACCEWFVRDWTDIETADKLRAARRPRPSSLKEQAFAVLDHTQKGYGLAEVDLDTIRRALEALDD